MAISKKDRLGESMERDLKGRDLSDSDGSNLKKYSVFLSERTVRRLGQQLPGLNISTGIRFAVEQYLKTQR